MKLLLTFAMLFSFCLSQAQQFTCGDQFVKYGLELEYPGIKDVISNTYKNAQIQGDLESSEVLRIPVVFHILYNTEEQNLSDEVIKSQIDVLNEDFRRLNANASETRDVFLDVAADAEIEFFLAGQDPDGNISTGITRTFTDNMSFVNFSFTEILAAISMCGLDVTNPQTIACIFEALNGLDGFDLDAMKRDASGGKDPWNTKRYLNIWVANLSIDAGGTSLPFVLGFAYPPMEAPNWPQDMLPDNLEEVDGVVLHYQTVGRNNPTVAELAGINDQGRTCVHEVGHYLGLRHIWGDGDCSMDDGLADTPDAGSNSQTADSSCENLLSKDSCVDDALPDMIENYMDYSIESCQNIFTVEQVGIMRSMLLGPRSELLENTISENQNLISSPFNVFPNPTNGLMFIESPDTLLEANVWNIDGQLLISNKLPTLDIGHLPTGTYLLELRSKSQYHVERVIVH